MTKFSTISLYLANFTRHIEFCNSLISNIYVYNVQLIPRQNFFNSVDLISNLSWHGHGSDLFVNSAPYLRLIVNIAVTIQYVRPLDLLFQPIPSTI